VTQLNTSRIPSGFTEKTVRVNGVTLNYATAGTGSAVVLLHGYPQTWYMWRSCRSLKWAWASSLAEGPWRACRGSWDGGAPSKCS